MAHAQRSTTPTKIPRLEAGFALQLPLIFGERCEAIEDDVLDCQSGTGFMPGGKLSLAWRPHEIFSVGVSTGLFINPAQPLPKNDGEEDGDGLYMWRTVLQPRLHFRPEPELDLFIGASGGWMQAFVERRLEDEDSSATRVGVATFGGDIGLDYALGRFSYGLALNMFATPFGSPTPLLRDGPVYRRIDESAFWLVFALRITTHLPL